MKYIVLIVALIVTSGCGGAKSPADLRSTARSAILSVAYGTQAAMEVCRDIAVPMYHQGDADHQAKAKSLAKACDNGYELTRSALLAAEASMDAWDDASEKRIACAAADAFRGLGLIRDAIAVYGTVPQPVEDGLAMSKWAASLANGVCAVQ